jgi:hypothetical protein
MNLVALSADYTPTPAMFGIKNGAVVRGVITCIAFPEPCALKTRFYPSVAGLCAVHPCGLADARLPASARDLCKHLIHWLTINALNPVIQAGV